MKHLFGWFVGLLLSGFAVAADDTYELRLHRPMKVGDRLKIAAKVAIDMQTRTILHADELEEEGVTAACRLAGELTVLSTTSKGLAKEVRMKLSEVECIKDGEDADFFKPGDLIYLRHDKPEKIIQVNGVEPDATQSEVIDTFLYVQGDESATDDELLGTPSKVKAGDSWPVNRQAMLKDWVEAGFAGLREDDLKGKTTLAEITKLDGAPAAKLQGEFRIENAGLHLPSMPEEVRAKRFTLEIQDETDLPLDPNALAVRSRMNLSMESESDGTIESEGEWVKVRMKLRQRCAFEMTVTSLE